MTFIEFIMLNTKLKFVCKSDSAFQRYYGLEINFSENFDSAFLVNKVSVNFKVKLTRTKSIC